ncbi:MAG: patatin-like phospholipase family protein [Bacillota bacterium]|nr:patatin-like phospholipase family protein [Bacillota bacterium]
MERKKIGLALGSGSAKGLAHIGVLKVLQQEKIPIDFIAGSSIGAVIGALYCCGADWHMLEKLASQLKQNHVVDLTVPRIGLIEGRKAHDLLKLLTQNKTFKDLKIPLAVTATDLEKGELIVIQEGLVADALRASISIPGIFKPYKWQGKVLVDGAVLERVPVSAVRDMGADIVIAVDVKAGRKTDTRSNKINNIFDVIMYAIDLLEVKAFTNCCSDANVAISPEIIDSGIFNFDIAEEYIKAGEEAAALQAAAIKKIMR